MDRKAQIEENLLQMTDKAKALEDEKTSLVSQTEDLAGSQHLIGQEVKYLRQARQEITRDKEDLVSDIRGHKQEIESVYKANKDLKNKVKRLESLLYGRHMKAKY